MSTRRGRAVALYRALSRLLPAHARRDREEMTLVFTALREEAPTVRERWARTAHGLLALARVLVVRGFFAGILGRLGQPELTNAVMAYVDARLGVELTGSGLEESETGDDE